MLSPKIETERLILRRYNETDVDAFYEILQDDRLREIIIHNEETFCHEYHNEYCCYLFNHLFHLFARHRPLPKPRKYNRP